MVALVDSAVGALERVIKRVHRLPLEEQQDFVNSAKSRLGIYERNLDIAREFHQVDEPKLRLAERFEKLEALLFDGRIGDFKAGIAELIAEHNPAHLNEFLTSLLVRSIDQGKTHLVAVILDSLQQINGKKPDLIFPPNFNLESWLLRLNQGQVEGLDTKQTERIFQVLGKNDLLKILSDIANRSHEESNRSYNDDLIQEARLFKRLIGLIQDNPRALATIYSIRACRASANPFIGEALEMLAPDAVRQQMPLGEVH